MVSVEYDEKGNKLEGHEKKKCEDCIKRTLQQSRFKLQLLQVLSRQEFPTEMETCLRVENYTGGKKSKIP